MDDYLKIFGKRNFKKVVNKKIREALQSETEKEINANGTLCDRKPKKVLILD